MLKDVRTKTRSPASPGPVQQNHAEKHITDERAVARTTQRAVHDGPPSGPQAATVSSKETQSVVTFALPSEVPTTRFEDVEIPPVHSGASGLDVAEAQAAEVHQRRDDAPTAVGLEKSVGGSRALPVPLPTWQTQAQAAQQQTYTRRLQSHPTPDGIPSYANATVAYGQYQESFQTPSPLQYPMHLLPHPYGTAAPQLRYGNLLLQQPGYPVSSHVSPHATSYGHEYVSGSRDTQVPPLAVMDHQHRNMYSGAEPYQYQNEIVLPTTNLPPGTCQRIPHVPQGFRDSRAMNNMDHGGRS